MKALRDKPLHVRVVRGFLLAIFLALAAFLTPTPYHVQAPGHPSDVEKMIKIESATYPSQGKFLLPTVVSEPATILYCIYSFFDPEAVLTRESDDRPKAQTPDSSDQQMALSQYLSSVVALEALGYDILGRLRGIRVLDLTQDSPNREILQRGDLILALKGQRLEDFKQFSDIVGKSKPGQTLSGEILRNEKTQEVQLEVYQPQDRPLIGVVMRAEYIPDFPFRINFQSGSTLGASGGLVFALQIYDLLTPEDLTKGRIIAATGTLDGNGGVGPIDGINFKLKGAQRAGAEVILIPQDNLKDVDWSPQGVKVIPVSSFNDALHALQK
ncbi:MAG TPA: PDZ domain-containing protein [Phycisphaerales bacterium]|nr:PDZ domain-containing protein [Phycisphaerales bacterium]